MKLSKFSERLVALQQFYKIKWEDLAKDFDTSGSTLSSWRSGRTNPTFGLVSFFAKKHPEINAKWLLTGDGEMLETSQEIIKELNETKLIDETELKKEIQKIWGKLQQIENQVESIKERQEEPSTTDSPTLSRSNTNKF
jgi:transcriptional regulator with XRE-family HTH domain